MRSAFFVVVCEGCGPNRSGVWGFLQPYRLKRDTLLQFPVHQSQYVDGFKWNKSHTTGSKSTIGDCGGASIAKYLWQNTAAVAIVSWGLVLKHKFGSVYTYSLRRLTLWASSQHLWGSHSKPTFDVSRFQSLKKASKHLWLEVQIDNRLSAVQSLGNA